MTQQTLQFDATDARDRAMQQVEENAGPDFAARAAEFAVEFFRRHPGSSGEDLVDAGEAAGIVAHDPRAWGPVIMRLSRSGVIEKCGFGQRRKGHATSGANLWKLSRD